MQPDPNEAFQLLIALQKEAVTFPMVNVIRCVCCQETWTATEDENHLDGCPSGKALLLAQSMK